MHDRHALSAWKSMKACMRREMILMSRHSFVYFFRLLQVSLQTACVPLYTQSDNGIPRQGLSYRHTSAHHSANTHIA